MRRGSGKPDAPAEGTTEVPGVVGLSPMVRTDRLADAVVE
jgi:hypothetical protein